MDLTKPNPYVVGKIGKPVSELENSAPNDGYKEYIHDTWKAVIVACDPRERDNAQKVAIQFHIDVGSPSTLAPRLLQAMEEGHGRTQKCTAGWRMCCMKRLEKSMTVQGSDWQMTQIQSPVNAPPAQVDGRVRRIRSVNRHFLRFPVLKQALQSFRYCARTQLLRNKDVAINT
ncbi:MAG: hypothetical protein ABJJ53_16965 [Sulfitobacter sp.]